MHQRDVVIARDDVPERAQPLLDALDRDGGGQRIPEVLELLVGGGGGDQEAVAVAGGEPADDARAGDGGVDDGDDVGELGLEDGVKVGGGGDGGEAVAGVRASARAGAGAVSLAWTARMYGRAGRPSVRVSEGD